MFVYGTIVTCFTSGCLMTGFWIYDTYRYILSVYIRRARIFIYNIYYIYILFPRNPIGYECLIVCDLET